MASFKRNPLVLYVGSIVPSRYAQLPGISDGGGSDGGGGSAPVCGYGYSPVLCALSSIVGLKVTRQLFIMPIGMALPLP